MSSSHFYRLSAEESLDAWSRPRSRKRHIRGVKEVDLAKDPSRRASLWELVALIAAMTGMGILAWKLHVSQSETHRLKVEVQNLTTIARATLADSSYTKRLLGDANADKRMLTRFLTDAGAAEADLKQSLTSLHRTHERSMATHEQQAQEWSLQNQALSAQSTQLQTSLYDEANQRAEAQQAAAFYEDKSEQLEGEAQNLKQAVIGLRHENGAMDYEIGRLRHDLSSAESANATLRSSNASLEHEVSRQNSCISSLESKISCLEREICQLRSACKDPK